MPYLLLFQKASPNRGSYCKRNIRSYQVHVREKRRKKKEKKFLYLDGNWIDCAVNFKAALLEHHHWCVVDASTCGRHSEAFIGTKQQTLWALHLCLKESCNHTHPQGRSGWAVWFCQQRDRLAWNDKAEGIKKNIFWSANQMMFNLNC